MAQCSLDVEGVGFVKSAPPPTATPELQESNKLMEDQRMAIEGLRGEDCLFFLSPLFRTLQ